MSLLKQITKGKKIKPLAILAHGPHGIGKTSFASKSRNPIYIGQEENDEIDAARFPKVSSWQELRDQLGTLLNEKHDYKTLVIDTIDGLQQTAEATILSGQNKNKNMATAMGGFGKAYEEMGKMFKDLRDEFIIPLRDVKGMNIVLLSHSEKIKHEDPLTMTSYDTWQTSLHKKVKPIFEDWVSAIIFMNFELTRAERSSDGKEYAIGDGQRVMFTEERPSHIAKNRFNLEYEMPLEWSDLSKGVNAFYKSGKKAETKKPEPKKVKKEEEEKAEKEPTKNDESEEVKFQIEALMKGLDEETMETVYASYERAGNDTEKLKRVLKKLETMTA